MALTLIEGAQRERHRVVIAGGGVAALEALLALTEIAPDHVAIELVSPKREMTFRALSVAEPFGLSESGQVDMAAAATERGAKFREDMIDTVSPGHVKLRSGERLRFDSLLLTTGSQPIQTLPGALEFGGTEGVPEFRELLFELAQEKIAGLAFVVPRGVHWSLPLYELALMTAARCAALGIDPEIHLVTIEGRPLRLFGPAVSDHVEALLDQAGITLHVGTEALAVHPRRLLLAPLGALAVDRVVAIPRRRAPHITGVPRGKGGFIPVDDFGRVHGVQGVYAAGDATWYPVKQGGLAAQQADAAATAIAAAAGAPVVPEPFEPVLRGVLLTGGAPEYLRAPNGQPGGVSDEALWWPPAKVAGRYLGPYLAGLGTSSALHDVSDDHHPALALALDAAEAAAGWGDFDTALRWLDVAERLNIVLPPGFAEKRAEWRELAGVGVGARRDR